PVDHSAKSDFAQSGTISSTRTIIWQGANYGCRYRTAQHRGAHPVGRGPVGLARPQPRGHPDHTGTARRAGSATAISSRQSKRRRVMGAGESRYQAARKTMNVVIRPEAEADIAEAYDYYQTVSEGLGAAFLLAVEACFDGIERSPEMYAV